MADALHRIHLTRERADAPAAALIRFLDPATRAPKRIASVLFETETERRIHAPLRGDEIVEVLASDPDGSFAARIARLDPLRRLYHAARLARGALRPPVRSPLAAPPHPPRFARPDPAPTVSLIIATRDRADLLARAIDTAFARSAYPAKELVIVDNGSVERATADLLAHSAHAHAAQILRRDVPFNFAQLMNGAARAAGGDILVFLNNDIEALDPAWLDPLVALAAQLDIGAVGAKLLYPNGAVQHAGIVLGMGGFVGHAGRGLPSTARGPHDMLRTVRDVAAVTGACLAMRRDAFVRVGGFDERFAVECNDVDLCLRLRATGLRVVWTPWPTLIHKEGATRGRDSTQSPQVIEDRTLFFRQWRAALAVDPFFPAPLSRRDETLPADPED